MQTDSSPLDALPIETDTAAVQDAAGNMENFFSYSVMQWDAVSHVLTLGFGIFAAALVYFVISIRYVAPRFRLSNILSSIVMVSAMLILLRQAIDWDMTFAANAMGEYERKDGQLFSNGYRYMNWSIDVPVLLIQLLVIVPMAAKAKVSRATQFIIAGLGMIWTSWAAQFYETGGIVEGTSSAPFWIWYLISWAFYIWILGIVFKTISDGKKGVPDKAKKVLDAILWLLVISWTAYAVAIILPQVWFSSGAGVARQYIFTTADVVSKAIYGVLLGWVATICTVHGEDQSQTYPDDMAVLTPTKGGDPDKLAGVGTTPPPPATG
jgi:bacteriorhodopsin